MPNDSLLRELEDNRIFLKHKLEEIKQQEVLKDIDARLTDLERRRALFATSKQRLERGGKTLEAGEDYEAIKNLRESKEKNRIKQSSLRDELTAARTDLHNAEEALNLVEIDYRNKLAAQTKLKNLIQKVKILDEQVNERQQGVNDFRKEHERISLQVKEAYDELQRERTDFTKIELALREARKFLQVHSIDEKLQTALPGIKKRFTMYAQAEDKRKTLKSSWADAIKIRQEAQTKLNDRASTLADLNHRFEVLEKNYTRSKAFFENSMKGKLISEWREICDKNIKRLAELDELYKNFQEAKSLEDQINNLQEEKNKINNEIRSLHIANVEQSAKIHELELEEAKLDKRASLIKKLGDLDALRELLQETIPCPLCGSVAHPYSVGGLIPDPQEIFGQLAEISNEIANLKAEISQRNSNEEQLNKKIEEINNNRTALKTKILEANSSISSKVAALGVRIAPNISPFEEIDKVRQTTRDNLQIARTNAENAEAAQREMQTALDEFEKIQQTRNEAGRVHQEAVFNLQSKQNQESQLENEYKAQEEIVNSHSRELISLIVPFGYKALPDNNPEEILSALAERLQAWRENYKRSNELEHEAASANTKLKAMKNNYDKLQIKRDELLNRVKATEAERASIQQQRIIAFASRNPDEEDSRMTKEIEALRVKLNERRDSKAEKAAKFDKVQSAIHALETAMTQERDELQRYETAFSKKLLALGFKNEDDYASACLTKEERKELQRRLRELTQEELDLKAERENVRAKILDLQAEKESFNNQELIFKAQDLKKSWEKFEASGEEIPGAYREILAEIRNLMLQCSLPEVFS